MKKISTFVVLLMTLAIVGCRAQTPVAPRPLAPTPTINTNQPATDTMDQKAATTSDDIMKPATSTGSVAPIEQTKEFKITAENWQFTPSSVTVKKGDKVRLIITSNDGTHGFSIPAFNVSQSISGGQTITVEFVADKVGTFPFSCNVYCGEGHKEMIGNIIVTE